MTTIDHEGRTEVHELPQHQLTRGPESGDWLIRHEDGHYSWMPRSTFEGSHDVPETPDAPPSDTAGDPGFRGAAPAAADPTPQPEDGPPKSRRRRSSDREEDNTAPAPEL